jgi:hypothetical protein
MLFVTTLPGKLAATDVQAFVSLITVRNTAVAPTTVWFSPGRRCLS